LETIGTVPAPWFPRPPPTVSTASRLNLFQQFTSPALRPRSNALGVLLKLVIAGLLRIARQSGGFSATRAGAVPSRIGVSVRAGLYLFQQFTRPTLRRFLLPLRHASIAGGCGATSGRRRP
jgi:hypothetical protein